MKLNKHCDKKLASYNRQSPPGTLVALTILGVFAQLVLERIEGFVWISVILLILQSVSLVNAQPPWQSVEDLETASWSPQEKIGAVVFA